MDGKKILTIFVVLVLVVAGIGVFLYWNGSNSSKGDVSVVYLNKSGYEAIMVADSKGYFTGVNVAYNIVSGSGQDAVNAMLAGSADIAATGDGPAINTLNKYGDEVVILGSYSYGTGGQVWVSKANTGIVTYDEETDNREAVAESLSGKVIGVNQGSTTESELKAWLEFVGVGYNGCGYAATYDVTLSYINTTNIVAALAIGSIDVLAASQPFPATALTEVSGSYKIGSNADTDSYGVSILITTKTIYDSKTDEIKEFMRGIKKATDYMTNNNEDCVKICAAKIGWSEEAQRMSFEGTVMKTIYDDDVIDTLYSTAVKKGFSGTLTREFISASCPMKDWLAGLYE